MVEAVEFAKTIEIMGKAIDGLGVFVTIVGVCAAVAVFGYRLSQDGKGDREAAYGEARRNMGRSILFGLELLVAGDIIRTVATTPTFESVAVLGIIVLIRTWLSFSLEVEITGRWPWQRSPSQPPG